METKNQTIEIHDPKWGLLNSVILRNNRLVLRDHVAQTEALIRPDVWPQIQEAINHIINEPES